MVTLIDCKIRIKASQQRKHSWMNQRQVQHESPYWGNADSAGELIAIEKVLQRATVLMMHLLRPERYQIISFLTRKQLCLNLGSFIYPTEEQIPRQCLSESKRVTQNLHLLNSGMVNLHPSEPRHLNQNLSEPRITCVNLSVHLSEPKCRFWSNFDLTNYDLVWFKSICSSVVIYLTTVGIYLFMKYVLWILWLTFNS